MSEVFSSEQVEPVESAAACLPNTEEERRCVYNCAHCVKRGSSLVGKRLRGGFLACLSNASDTLDIHTHVFLLAYKYPPSDHMCMYCICSCDQNVCGADYSDYSLVCVRQMIFRHAHADHKCFHHVQDSGAILLCKEIYCYLGISYVSVATYLT